VPSDFHVLLHLKTLLGGQQFHDNTEATEAINTRFALQAALFYDAEIQNLVPHYDKCLNNVETVLKSSVECVYQMARLEINCFSSRAHRNLLPG
jgi:hypothetical protein